ASRSGSITAISSLSGSVLRAWALPVLPPSLCQRPASALNVAASAAIAAARVVAARVAGAAGAAPAGGGGGPGGGGARRGVAGRAGWGRGRRRPARWWRWPAWRGARRWRFAWRGARWWRWPAWRGAYAAGAGARLTADTGW